MPTERIWDLKPDDGGDPVMVVVGNATEAIQRDPGRYSRRAPDGTAHGEEQRRAEEAAAKRAEIRGREIERLNEIARDAAQKRRAILEEEAKAAEERREREREEAREARDKAAEEADIPPSRRAELDRIEADQLAESEKVRLETADELAALEAQPPGRQLRTGTPTRPVPPGNETVGPPVPDLRERPGPVPSPDVGTPTPQGQPFPQPEPPAPAGGKRKA